MYIYPNIVFIQPLVLRLGRQTDGKFNTQTKQGSKYTNTCTRLEDLIFCLALIQTLWEEIKRKFFAFLYLFFRAFPGLPSPRKGEYPHMNT